MRDLYSGLGGGRGGHREKVDRTGHGGGKLLRPYYTKSRVLYGLHLSTNQISFDRLGSQCTFCLWTVIVWPSL